MDYDTTISLAERLLQWSWADKDKHPKDRLTDHQALDIALRMQAGHEPAGSAGFTIGPEGARLRKLGE